MIANDTDLRVFMVAGEPSGDQLGGKLIAEIKRRTNGKVRFAGVGGTAMENEGCASLFPLSDVAVMGPLAILSRLPSLARRVYQTVDAALAFDPDVLVILDSPEFTHPIAKRVRRKAPGIPVVDYVSPSVWAWRPGRARRMRAYVDHVLALLPFEPGTHKRLGGPDCSYVGHPLVERLEWMQAIDPDALGKSLGLSGERPVLAILPGSRSSEVKRLLEPFGRTTEHLLQRLGQIDIVVPVVESVRPLIEEGVSGWPVKPHLVDGEERKFQAFRLANAALAASGTVTLELALSGTPLVVAYKVEPLAWSLRWLVKVPSVVLPNLILEENAFPEFLQDECSPERLCEALLPLLSEGPERMQQLEAIDRLQKRMKLDHGTPSGKAAEIILDLAAAEKSST